MTDWRARAAMSVGQADPIDAAIRSAHEVAQRQRERRDALRAALAEGDLASVVRCARELVCGDEGDRAPQG